ncbi:MAG: undecaprenyldiphospho-muramoylpentapeptide beta-N-acetylglucosaminyltransferase [Candidatus Cloacimonetes bacterium]|nr:undecaprenyldiphospho-muramoylpentapeptide beta-N-acetylglucosaminyltransferase [Candidatus Cloacimonadota bacterium]MCF7814123.1 undecaprenyldiphospho-muramoylpentapeptide beta-N-acetylglucosaminyltransferase [Candidatus Cloacimonadota bacterium]MCF7868728.1 undecaprenyldiphospho-muramoylpentapeptide beta-N-acetylglucosaminyltransferase [Candidatus Cloacimonadota bacterium]MCF7884122.1 undecaprenyldiphospho-muramoylpentapeptide beta-N-acetylglucosaminyltransferase [Candidatus Cloacimonadota 
MRKKVIVAAGGTGGHIFPALAIAKKLRENDVEILYVGNKNSMEEKLATKAGFDFSPINVQKLHRNLTAKHILFPIKLFKSIQDSKQIIRNFQPDAFVGTGGFVCGPVGFAAHKCKIPIFMQEQNSFPGLTTRKLSKYAKKVFLGNKGAAKYLPKNILAFAGNPINTSVVQEESQIDFDEGNLKKDSLKLFLYGGSQGSYILNKALFPIIDKILQAGIEIIWQIGKYSFDEFYPKVKGKNGIFAFEFTHEMGKILNSTDFVICRAGALSLAEIETKKLPAIIVPLPSAAGNHQYYNAMELVDNKTAILLEQKNLTPKILFEKILDIQENHPKMKANYKDSLHVNAAEVIVKTILRNME